MAPWLCLDLLDLKRQLKFPDLFLTPDSRKLCCWSLHCSGWRRPIKGRKPNSLSWLKLSERVEGGSQWKLTAGGFLVRSALKQRRCHQNSSAALGKASRWLWMERGDAWSCCLDTNCWVAQVRLSEDQRPETPDDACSFTEDVQAQPSRCLEIWLDVWNGFKTGFPM